MGKTFAYSAKLAAAMWEYLGIHPWWWCAPTYRQSKAAQRVMYQITKSAGIRKSGPRPPFETNPPRALQLINGATCEYRTWDNPENLMGDPIAGGVIDEAGLLSDEAASNISTRRSFTLGPLWYIGNPGRLTGPFERLCKEADELGAFYRWTWRELYEWLTEHDPVRAKAYLEHIEHERKTFGKKEFKRLYEAEWADWNELPAYEFDRAVHIDAERAEYDPHLPIELACDFNVDPMAWTLGQHRHADVWTFDEIVIPGGATTRAACEEFICRHPDPLTEVVVYGDASGSWRNTKSKQSDYDVMRQAFGAHYRHPPRFEIPTQNGPVSERLNCVNAKLRAADGTVSYWMHPRCKNLIDDRARVSLLPGTHDIDKRDKKRTHSSDGDDYRIVRLYPIADEPFIYTPKPMGIDPILSMGN